MVFGVLMAPAAGAQGAWQASVSPAIELAVRQSGEAFTAVAVLTSPRGAIRRQTVRAGPSGYAAVRFGDATGDDGWGPADARFGPATYGHWTWSFRVRGADVAHGSFMLSRGRDGSSSIRADAPNFAH